MSGVLGIVPRMLAVNAGAYVSGAKLFCYNAGTTTKRNTYTTSALSVANANPLVVDSNGRFASFWLDADDGAYKLVLAPSSDTDPPASPIWTEDNVVAGIGLSPAETGVTVINYQYPPGNVLRYGTNSVPGGSTPMTTAIQAALNVAHAGLGEAFIPAGTYLTGKINWPGNNLTLRGAGSSYAYNSSDTPRTRLVAAAETTIVLDLTQTGGCGGSKRELDCRPRHRWQRHRQRRY